MLTLMFITNHPDTAYMAVQAGVDRIFVDLEHNGKEIRQHGRNTVISNHCVEDISGLREQLPDTEILVRTNPMHDKLKQEVENIIARGPDLVMLPMFSHPTEVARFIDYVNGRARVSLLLETPQAMVRLPKLLELKDGINEIHVGLNDLHIGLGLNFMFECVSSGLIDFIAEQVLSSGIRFGFGGIGRLGTGIVPAELVLNEHVRIGSSMVILSRAFHQGFDGSLSDEIRELRVEEERLLELPESLLFQNQIVFNQRVWQAAKCD